MPETKSNYFRIIKIYPNEEKKNMAKNVFFLFQLKVRLPLIIIFSMRYDLHYDLTFIFFVAFWNP